MRKLILSLAVILVISCCLFISWRSNTTDDLADKLSKSVNFIQWNMALSNYNKEARLLFHQQKNNGEYKRIKQSDLDKIMNDSKLSSAEKIEALKKTGPPSSPTMDANFKKSLLLNEEINKEFPELSSLPPETRKAVLLRAIKIYDKKVNANYLDN